MDELLSAIMAIVLLILCWMSSWAWLQFAKYPTKRNQENAARFTGWAFGFLGIIAGAWILTL